MKSEQFPVPSDQTLTSVYFENVANNQIGGLTDGMDPEVARDLGFDDPDSALRKIEGRNDSDHIRPQDMVFPEPVAKAIPDDAQAAIDKLRDASPSKKYRISSREAGRLAAKNYLDDKFKLGD